MFRALISPVVILSVEFKPTFPFFHKTSKSPVDAPEKPRCLICISIPDTGAAVNSMVFDEPPTTSYDPATPSVVGC